MKISNQDWMFLAGGLALGYFLVPKILHHADQTVDPSLVGSDTPDLSSLSPDISTTPPPPPADQFQFQFVPQQQQQPRIITIPVPINIPSNAKNATKTGSNADQFGARVEALIRNACPNGSIGPDSSVCRANIMKFYHDAAAGWAVSDSNLRSLLEKSVASSTNCCCTPKSMPCQYSAHLSGNKTATVLQP